MFHLFLYRDTGEPAGRTSLLEQSVSLYVQNYGIVPDVTDGDGKPVRSWVLARTEKGKPYLMNPDGGKPLSNLHLSVSHSGGLLGILIGPAVCGLDIQKMKPVDWRRLASRIFPEADMTPDLTEEEGRKRFYRLWCRREALAKYTGLGFFGVSGVSGIPGERPDDGVFFYELDLGEGFMAVWCSGEENDEIVCIG